MCTWLQSCREEHLPGVDWHGLGVLAYVLVYNDHPLRPGVDPERIDGDAEYNKEYFDKDFYITLNRYKRQSVSYPISFRFVDRQSSQIAPSRVQQMWATLRQLQPAFKASSVSY